VATVVEGVCVTLDPEFDFISVATDYLTEEGYREESIKQFLEGAGDQVQQSAKSLVTVPPKLERVLDRVERENVTVNVRVEDKNNVFDRLAKRIVYGFLLAVGILSTAILYAFPTPNNVIPPVIAALSTLPIAFLLWRSFRSKKGLRAKPQFTRQGMKERRRE
jgi:hypothetical protein